MLLSIAVITGLETLPLVLIPLALVTVRTRWNWQIKRVICGSSFYCRRFVGRRDCPG